MDTVIIIIIAAVALVVIAGAVIAWMVREDNQRKEGLKESFGPEYDRVAAEQGDTGRAAKELEARQKRVEDFKLKPLSTTDSARFSEQWRNAQEKFVDDPAAAIATADDLITEVMTTRGYPMSEFDQRAADISVGHPQTIDNYRRAHATSEANERGEASTEDLRQAMVYYRSLFDDLVDERSKVAANSRR